MLNPPHHSLMNFVSVSVTCCLILLQSCMILWRIKKHQLKHKPFYNDWVNNRTHLEQLKVWTWVIYCRILFFILFFFQRGTLMKETLHLQWEKETTIITFFFLPLLRRSNFFQLFMEFVCLTHRPQVVDTHTTIVQVQLEHMVVN